MNQYFIKSKQPIFVSFNRTIKNSATDLDFDLQLIKNFEEHFEEEQQESWLKFWHKQGEEEVLRAWNEKYKDFLKEQDCLTGDTETETKDSKQSEEGGVSNEALSETSWEELWHEHREETYKQLYLIFSTIFYNYFLYLKKSCEITPVIFEGEVEDDTQIIDNQQLINEIGQLEILGLPTTFGGRPQNSSKKYKKPTQNYSEFFSDSEMENDTNESDVEEYDDDDNDDDETVTLEQKENSDNFLHNVKQSSLSKIHKRKRNRNMKNVPSFILEDKGLLKYWRKRFSLFSRFDEGIRLDRESWFSVTPEKVAKHLAERLKTGIIVDGFCGSGGNIIQFALTCDKVIAIDIDPAKLDMAKHNAQIYNVAHKIEFILGDFMHLAAGGKLKADAVFLSPPWGGPKYKNKKQFDIEKYLLPASATDLMQASRNITENIALFLPRNSNIKQIVKLAGIGKRCEIEHNYLDSRLVAITALYGEQILTQSSDRQ